jgi:AbrB family looped-hinge helix DNA binding protein
MTIKVNLLYSIPVKVVESNNAKKCSIPKQIANKLDIKKGDTLIWSYYDNGTIHVKVER